MRSRIVKLTHANLNRPLSVLTENIEAWHWNEPTKSMIIYTSRFGIFPVKETEEQIDQLITAAYGKGEHNE